VDNKVIIIIIIISLPEVMLRSYISELETNRVQDNYINKKFSQESGVNIQNSESY